VFQAEVAAAAFAHTREDAVGAAAGVCHEATAIDLANWEFEVDGNVYFGGVGEGVLGYVTLGVVQRVGRSDGEFVTESGGGSFFSRVHLFARVAGRQERGVLKLR